MAINRHHDINYHQFDVHLSHACNFTCESCSHYSNYHFSGNLPLETAEAWYQKWALRLRPFRINLLGGEPAINPKLTEHVVLARKYWPAAELYLYTNGFLLHRHPQFPAAVRNVGNFIIKLSRHYNSAEYEKTFEQVVSLLKTWQSQYGIKFAVSESFSKWTMRYIDQDHQLSPFHDNNPKQSWEICNAKYCLQMHEGKLWKCPILAYLPMVKQKLGLSKEWDQYLTYKPLDPDCSESELHEFLARREEPFCSACPAFKRPFPKNDPTKPAKKTAPPLVA
ncbi:MAG: radical SAM protein [Patescibacteria group bacterium]|nr:radical SAM protein [Patescibacteria group bacterium]